MLILSLAIIPLLVIPLVMDLSPSADSTVFAIDLFIWAVFALEYGIRLSLAPVKGQFVRSNVIDLIVVLIPFLRPLRVAASFRMLRLLRDVGPDLQTFGWPQTFAVDSGLTRGGMPL